MPRFRSNPVEIDAVRVTWQTWDEVCALIERYGGRFGRTADEWTRNPKVVTPGRYITAEEASDTCGEPGPQYIAFDVPTMHGERATVRHGDWLIPDGKPGTFYPCKPDVFAAKYSPTMLVPEAEATAAKDEPQARALLAVVAERHRQDAKHGGAAHDDTHMPEDWVNLRAGYEGRAVETNDDARRDALVKVAALAVAQIEAHDRRQVEIRKAIDRLAPADEPKQITSGGE